MLLYAGLCRNCPHTGCPPKCPPPPPPNSPPDPFHCLWPNWMVWKKEVAKGQVAVLLMNNGNNASDVSGE